MESSETRKLFISRERVHVDRQMGRLREPHPHDSLNHLYGAFLLGFLWPVILLWVILSLY